MSILLGYPRNQETWLVACAHIADNGIDGLRRTNFDPFRPFTHFEKSWDIHAMLKILAINRNGILLTDQPVQIRMN